MNWKIEIRKVKIKKHKYTKTQGANIYICVNLIYIQTYLCYKVVRMERGGVLNKVNPKKIALANDVSTGMIYSCQFKDAKVEWNDRTKNKENKKE